MRLHGHNIHRMWKHHWKVQSKSKVFDLGIPFVLQQKGVTVLDAQDVARPKRKKLHLVVPEPYRTYLNEKYNCPVEYPNKQDRPAYRFSKKTRLVQGNQHIQNLIKTVQYPNLPKSLQDKVNEAQEFSNDDAVQKSIQHAVQWDAVQRKLPKRIDVTRPGAKFPRDYGVPHRRKVTNLMHELIFLSEKTLSERKGKTARVKITDAFSKFYIEKGSDLLLFEVKTDLLLSDEHMLPPFSGKDEVESTSSLELPDIYPLKPTLDLEKTDIYTLEDIFPLPFHSCTKRNIHTVGVLHDRINYWFPPQKVATTIGSLFTFAASQARQQFGSDVKVLPSPISVQGFHLDKNNCIIAAYQLNTLDFTSDDGIKNQVWVDGPHPLFESCNDSGLQGYNPSVFARILGLLLNGAV